MIELRALVLLLKRSLHWVVFAGLFGLCIGFLLGAWFSRSSLSEAVVSLSYQSIGDPHGLATLDGYYVIETERRYGELLAQLLRSESLTSSFFQVSGASLGRVERISSDDFRVRWRGGRANATDTSQVLSGLLKKEFQESVHGSAEPLRATVAVTQAALLKAPSFAALAFAGSLVGLILGTFLILLRHYFRATSH